MLIGPFISRRILLSYSLLLNFTMLNFNFALIVSSFLEGVFISGPFGDALALLLLSIGTYLLIT